MDDNPGGGCCGCVLWLIGLWVLAAIGVAVQNFIGIRI